MGFGALKEEPGRTMTVQEGIDIATRTAQPPPDAVREVAEYQDFGGTPAFVVRWAHKVNGWPVERDFIEALVNGNTKKVFVRVRVASRDPRRPTPAAGPAVSWVSSRPISPTAQRRERGPRRNRSRQPVRRVRQRDADRPRRRREERRRGREDKPARPARPYLGDRCRPAQSNLQRDQKRRRSGGAQGFSKGDDHPPVAGVRAGGRPHQPLRRHGQPAVAPRARAKRTFSRSMSATSARPSPRPRSSRWPMAARSTRLADRR